jgi:uncharacterized protein
MNSTSLYEVTIPVFTHFLGNLRGILNEGKRLTKKGAVREEVLITARLAPDMYTFTQQIGYAYFMALEAATILSGKDMPVFTYDEKNVKELDASLARAIAFLKTVRPAHFKKSERKRVKTFLHPTKRFARETYVYTLALPNFFFHVTTAYDIFRNQGVPLRKEHYLGVE